MKVWGFEVNRVAHEIMEIVLDSEVLVINEPIYNEIIKEAMSRNDFERMVLEAKGKTLEDWQASKLSV